MRLECQGRMEFRWCRSELRERSSQSKSRLVGSGRKIASDQAQLANEGIEPRGQATLGGDAFSGLEANRDLANLARRR